MHKDSSERLKTKKMKLLKQELKKNPKLIKFEDQYRVILPTRQHHNHPFEGKNRIMHPIVIARLHDLVESGVTSSCQIKEILEDHIKNMFSNDPVPPYQNDEAYYPSQRKIKDAIYNYNKRKCPSTGGRYFLESCC